MAFSDLYDSRIPEWIRDIAIERLRNNHSLQERSDISEADRRLVIQLIHSALPELELKMWERALMRGISPKTQQRRRNSRQ